MRDRWTVGLLALALGASCGPAPATVRPGGSPEPAPAADAWRLVACHSSPAPGFGPSPEILVRRIEDDAFTVGALRVRLGEETALARDVATSPIVEVARLDGRLLFASLDGAGYTSDSPLGALDPLGIEAHGQWSSWQRVADRMYVRTRTGHAYVVRGSRAERLPIARWVWSIDPAPDGHDALVTVTPGLVYRVGDDGTIALAGHAAGVPASMLRAHGAEGPEVPDPEPEPWTDATDEERAARRAAYRATAAVLGYPALAGDIVSPFDASGMPAVELDAYVHPDDRPSYRVRADGVMRVTDRFVAVTDRAGRAVVDGIEVWRETLVPSDRAQRFLLRSTTCEGERDEKKACLFDGDARVPLDWASLFAAATDGLDEPRVVATLLVGRTVVFVVASSGALVLSRVPLDGTSPTRRVVRNADGAPLGSTTPAPSASPRSPTTSEPSSRIASACRTGRSRLARSPTEPRSGRPSSAASPAS